MMTLRSIPPANRGRNPAGPSSMRAATRVGMIFVGSRVGVASQPSEDEFVPNVNMIPPDKVHLASRQAFLSAMADKVGYWREELETWEREFGPEAAGKLRDWVESMMGAL